MGIMLLAWLILQPSGTPSFDWSQYGPVGAIAALGLAFFYGAYKREKDRADRLEGELRELNKAVRVGPSAELSRAVDQIAAMLERERNR